MEAVGQGVMTVYLVDLILREADQRCVCGIAAFLALMSFEKCLMFAIWRFSRFEEASGYCGRCLRQTPVGRQGINHVPHLILTLMTGLWAIFWIRDARRPRQWQCLDCGATVYKIMSNPFEKTKRKRR